MVSLSPHLYKWVPTNCLLKANLKLSIQLLWKWEFCFSRVGFFGTSEDLSLKISK